METQFDIMCAMIDGHKTDDCLVWPFYIDKDGYGKVWFEGNNRQTHRVAFQYQHGPITGEDVIRHDCDNPPCFSPRHLLKGSHADNVEDRVSRGRSACGQKNGRSKLTEENVREIYLSKEPKMHLAARFGVVPKAIRNIKQGKDWLSVTSSMSAPA